MLVCRPPVELAQGPLVQGEEARIVLREDEAEVLADEKDKAGEARVLRQRDL
jgi:hypothetical protein